MKEQPSIQCLCVTHGLNPRQPTCDVYAGGRSGQPCKHCGHLIGCHQKAHEAFSQCDASGSDQLRKELHDVIRRYGEESDVTVYQAVGVLEIVKVDLIEMLERAKDK